jgi:hypothetical protein
MLRSSVKKRVCYAAAAYLMLATVGTFTFMSLDSPYFEERVTEMTDQGAFLTALVPALECPAISRTKERAFSPSRQYLPRMIMPIGFFVAGTGILCAAAKLMTGTPAYNIKNTILLKLRI